MAKRTMAQSMLSALHQLSAVEKQHLTQFESVIMTHKEYLEGLIASTSAKFAASQQPQAAVAAPAVDMPPPDHEEGTVSLQPPRKKAARGKAAAKTQAPADAATPQAPTTIDQGQQAAVTGMDEDPDPPPTAVPSHTDPAPDPAGPSAPTEQPQGGDGKQRTRGSRKGRTTAAAVTAVAAAEPAVAATAAAASASHEQLPEPVQPEPLLARKATRASSRVAASASAAPAAVVAAPAPNKRARTTKAKAAAAALAVIAEVAGAPRHT
ncbi:MAG: hypothetical protein WDW36_003658 [Sanguina aurantia]